MSGLKLKVDNRAVLKKFAALDQAVQSSKLEAATKAGALIVLNAAKAKVRYQSGTLRRSIHMEVDVSTPTRCRVLVGTDLVYAAIHEFGGTISPKGRFLVFKGADGKMVFLTRPVTISAQPYMRPAIDENKDEVKREIGEALADLLRGV